MGIVFSGSDRVIVMVMIFGVFSGHHWLFCIDWAILNVEGCQT